MPTLPEPNCRLEGTELNVSLMLKVPIDIEAKLGMSPTSNEKEQDLVSQTEIINSAVVMSEVNQVEFEEQIRILSNQIVAQLFQKGEVLSTFEETQDNLGNQESTTISDSSGEDILSLEEDNAAIKEVKQTPERQKRRFIDSLNDGLTLAVNAVGTALFLGKLANYSWE
ncbi:hypothetical protein H6G81_19020 [Scytonema hofmannii FACHB-248]|uniref:Uncharacterized protein n=1 Tax=Scytonema hofmannii FACHB-248 TaxID=1842502 RepID=A0ABR8GTV8_9CYAN|nr:MULTISPECIES: hypothetical protein [Nostocales]MBD2606565.1 hypothetical protein [Scytonema hofmannii FACHB-248]